MSVSRLFVNVCAADSFPSPRATRLLVGLTVANLPKVMPSTLGWKAFMEKDPVQTRLVESGGGKVGYIKLREFNARCKRRVGEALGELQAQGATRLVLDLRGNGGGVLDGAVGISGFFSEKPLVLRMRSLFRVRRRRITVRLPPNPRSPS